MNRPRIVSRDEWLAARRQLLVKEKELTRLRDRLSAERRELPWVRVEKEYVFDAPEGRRTLAELFGGNSQLIVHHFMFGPGWKAGCKSCSFAADHAEGAIVHLEGPDYLRRNSGTSSSCSLTSPTSRSSKPCAAPSFLASRVSAGQ